MKLSEYHGNLTEMHYGQYLTAVSAEELNQYYKVEWAKKVYIHYNAVQMCIYSETKQPTFGGISNASISV